MRRTVAVLLIIALVLGFIRACVPSEHDREMKAWKEHANQAPQQPLDVGEEIPPSRPVEMRIPSLDMTATFEDTDCLFDGGAIAPSRPDQACAFTTADKPYELPGTSAGDIAVLAGVASSGGSATSGSAASDSSADGAGAFAPLADVRAIAPGDSMYLRTRESGDRWLKYQATDFHEPDQAGLSQSAAIWGNVPMPGRLITIARVGGAGAGGSGGSDADGAGPGGSGGVDGSVRNAVVGWQLQGVEDRAE